jgi:hypothetical protein
MNRKHPHLDAFAGGWIAGRIETWRSGREVRARIAVAKRQEMELRRLDAEYNAAILDRDADRAQHAVDQKRAVVFSSPAQQSRWSIPISRRSVIGVRPEAGPQSMTQAERQ